MNIYLELLFFFGFIGAFNSFLLCFYFIRKRSVSAFFFGFLLFCLGVRIGKSVLLYFYSDTPRIILQIGLSACFFIGPSLYFFLKADLEKVRIVPRNWKIVWLILVVFILGIGLIYPYETHPKIWNQYLVQMIYTVWGGFLLASAIPVFPLLYVKTSPTIQWYLAIFGANALVYIAYLSALLIPFRSIYISAAITFSTVFYGLLALILLQKKKIDLFNTSSKTIHKKYDEHIEAILNQLDSKMKDKKLFLNPNLKLNDLAAEVNISTHQLSQILNENLGKNFSEFINEYRINEACRLLFTHQNMSIDGIGNEVGFNSKSTFFAAFKKQKGITPAVFKQQNPKNSTVL
jgi:AraC-like DNA-binding protein